MSKETLCWECQNYSKCSWSIGIPVKNWDATPTICDVVIRDGKVERYIKSYCVHSCPQFKADKIRRITTKEITTILNITGTMFFRKVRTEDGRSEIIKWFEEKGYKLHIYNTKKCQRYYIEKVNNED